MNGALGQDATGIVAEKQLKRLVMPHAAQSRTTSVNIIGGVTEDGTVYVIWVLHRGSKALREVDGPVRRWKLFKMSADVVLIYD